MFWVIDSSNTICFESYKRCFTKINVLFIFLRIHYLFPSSLLYNIKKIKVVLRMWRLRHNRCSFEWVFNYGLIMDWTKFYNVDEFKCCLKYAFKNKTLFWTTILEWKITTIIFEIYLQCVIVKLCTRSSLKGNINCSHYDLMCHECENLSLECIIQEPQFYNNLP